MIKKICLFCEREFNAEERKDKFCCHKCSSEYRKKDTIYRCRHCKKEFITKSYRPRTYCSNRCHQLSKRRYITKNCKNCKKNFNVLSYNKSKFCSRRCYSDYKKQNISKICKYCNKEFFVPKSWINRIYCSKSCKLKDKEVKLKECRVCGNNFKAYNKNQKLCSLECRYKDMINPRIYNQCPICFKEFLPKNYHKNQKFCSNKCSSEFKHRNRITEIKCEKCGKLFKVISYYKDKKYCSKDCFNNRSNKICTCETCGRDFKISKSRRLGSTYCSKECFKNRNPKLLNKECLICGNKIIGTGTKKYCSLKCSKVGSIKHKCMFCNKEFKTRKNRSLFCSRICKNKYQSGENHPNFNNWSSLEPYDKAFSKIFKASIMERDSGCLMCNLSLEDLKLLNRRNHIHHINYNKLMSIKENCCTLCDSCHGKTNQLNRKSWTKFFQSILSERYGYRYDESGNIILNITKLQDSCKEVFK